MSTALDTIQSVQVSLTMKGTGTKTGSGNLSPNSGAANFALKPGSFKLGNTPPGELNELYDQVLTIAASGTDSLTLTGTLTDICNQTAGSLTKIVAMAIYLLPLTDPSGDGTACTSITLGDAASNAWAAILGATGTYKVQNGACWFHFDPAGLTVGGTDVLKILNNDSSHAAAVRVVIFGIG